ncbi:hypothetical protein K488DRAFT_84449 [Vararia minispora EC-137]|uniref:Uncharacterized protein n=1 Tax=Vararia minispora EC-137 TaxID=1314806 RepID=A0ACB8QQW8_9AGAM|nr:hypothetical protein K488DRAFT_84449 [Vararia minispora EC-137]
MQSFTSGSGTATPPAMEDFSGSGKATPDLSFTYDSSQQQSPVSNAADHFLPPLPTSLNTVTQFPASLDLGRGTHLAAGLAGLGPGTNPAIGNSLLSAGIMGDTAEKVLQRIQAENGTLRAHLFNVSAETDSVRREFLLLRGEVHQMRKAAEDMEARVDALDNTVSDLHSTVAELDEQHTSSIGPDRNSRAAHEKRNSKLENLVHERMQGMIGIPYKGRNARFNIPDEPPLGAALPIPGEALPDNYTWQPIWSKDPECPYNNAFITWCSRLVRRDDDTKRPEDWRLTDVTDKEIYQSSRRYFKTLRGRWERGHNADAQEKYYERRGEANAGRGQFEQGRSGIAASP